MAALLESRTAVTLTFVDCPVALQSYIPNIDIWQSTSAYSTVAPVKGCERTSSSTAPSASGSS